VSVSIEVKRNHRPERQQQQDTTERHETDHAQCGIAASGATLIVVQMRRAGSCRAEIEARPDVKVSSIDRK
jgi:hypothetical protein